MGTYVRMRVQYILSMYTTVVESLSILVPREQQTRCQIVKEKYACTIIEGVLVHVLHFILCTVANTCTVCYLPFLYATKMEDRSKYMYICSSL
jgi:hypothetical protein